VSEEREGQDQRRLPFHPKQGTARKYQNAPQKAVEFFLKEK
jgi:hypothetical protein